MAPSAWLAVDAPGERVGDAHCRSHAREGQAKAGRFTGQRELPPAAGRRRRAKVRLRLLGFTGCWCSPSMLSTLAAAALATLAAADTRPRVLIKHTTQPSTPDPT